MAKIHLFTDKWFDMVKKANQQAELNLSPTSKAICLNIVITDDTPTETPLILGQTLTEQQTTDDDNADSEASVNSTELYLFEGYFHKGQHPEAKTQVQMSQTTLQALLTSLEKDDAMHAFINGDILISGDMSQLMALQTTTISDEQKALFHTILENSTF